MQLTAGKALPFHCAPEMQANSSKCVYFITVHTQKSSS